jgi:hypothetical protein
MRFGKGVRTGVRRDRFELERRPDIGTRIDDEVASGTVTAYEGDDPTCTPLVYTQGMGFVDSGGDHVHVIRNEGAPGNCSF